ncbi:MULTISPECIES: tetratricopeptide repeat protein [Psychrobacter]|uniref:tetratricopeptide repeat protein n=1 Tax=Psychrobacter TaxID=497 RepID=UPI0018E32E43|nr:MULTISPECIES: tetratricopeptide repeat protein [Psychrobacter]
MILKDILSKFTHKKFVLILFLSILSSFIFLKVIEADDKKTQYDSVFDMQNYVIDNDPDKQLFLGDMYYFGDGISTGQDYDRAFELYQKAAQQGNAEAQHNLGVMYYSGKSVNQDYIEARKWFEKSADQNYADAQLSLGVIYEYGEGVSQDMAIAKEWFSKSCNNGNKDGCESYQLLDTK